MLCPFSKEMKLLCRSLDSALLPHLPKYPKYLSLLPSLSLYVNVLQLVFLLVTLLFGLLPSTMGYKMNTLPTFDVLCVTLKFLQTAHARNMPVLSTQVNEEPIL